MDLKCNLYTHTPQSSQKMDNSKQRIKAIKQRLRQAIDRDIVKDFNMLRSPHLRQAETNTYYNTWGASIVSWIGRLDESCIKVLWLFSHTPEKSKEQQRDG